MGGGGSAAPFGAVDRAPERSARLAGAMYLAIILLGAYGEIVVRGSLVVGGDPAATAAAILGSPLLWRSGIVADLLMHLLDVPTILILYRLLKPVGPTLALWMTGFNLVQTAVLVANKTTLVLPLLLLDSGGRLAAVPVAQQQVLAYLSVQTHGIGFGIGLLFFGVALLLRGHLVARSGFLPPLLGPLLQVAGVSYLVNSLALLLAPSLASALFPAVLLPALVGEAALCGWLLVKGVDSRAWAQRARGTPDGRRIDA